MFTERAVLWAYCLAPTHMGAGQGLGYVDAPVARERATNYPVLPASGLKGALRHAIETEQDAANPLVSVDVDAVFGKDVASEEDAAAGAMSLGDASLVAFPVRCLEEAFVWVTSPSALARLRRVVELGGSPVPWEIPRPDEGTALVADTRGRAHVLLDQYRFEARSADAVAQVGRIIGDGIGQEPLGRLVGADLADRLRRDLVVVPDSTFGFFMEGLLPVDPHVRIAETGTAVEGQLFFVEQVPAETVFAAPLLMAPRIERRGDGTAGQGRGSATGALAALANTVHDGLGGLLQIGGRASSGSGLVGVRIESQGGQ
ncbi:type III-B CRISPR module RAMP protein Cmr4 [Aciditerrimonas ferrireducens]|uniref:type III-B CRISPR module RAMP protein Cmr4 n=1 Tax=Aciditerrimonas ferrireducens TaxID=667306 RepID=UPI002003877D|nr:type III-B CRISPR module RAMP protein Cmr4 [Aciditerrimonas ferrireducens]MCK4176164.1 type III-B CRISPR module RAMP protein Cmr4 [Aciditerrimonas ferrireducens]